MKTTCINAKREELQENSSIKLIKLHMHNQHLAQASFSSQPFASLLIHF
jgi:hypothetical protein